MGHERVPRVHWTCSSRVKIDAFVAQPPVLQDVRARNIGDVIRSSITDHHGRSISAASMATSTGSLTEIFHRDPTRAARILKAADLFTSQPELMAQSTGQERIHDAGYDNAR